ncbi:thioester domain-containing protein [Actinomarinicola tropica]|uniref:thioester domain-containing protein n=1 Tax=Actinomarinicola tropica TaxID=2789776 RepID=UPI001897FB5E|nr:thioester domain-containing protein [Actinomarinicola tropica]
MTRQTRREPGAGPRRSYVVLAAIALAAAVLSIGTPAAEAASSGDLVGTGRGAQIEGTVDGGPVLGYWAGEMRLRIDGGTEVTAWCIDLHTSIDVVSGSDLEEVDWVTSGIRDLDRVSFVLHTYDADDATLPGSPDERAAGIQAAIWHLTDGFELASASSVPAVVAVYEQVLGSIPLEGLPVEPPPSLALTPSSATVLRGEVAGPFTVATTAGGVAVDAGGADLLDWDTGAPLGAVVDGSRLGIRSEVEGRVTLTATASAVVHAGRAFAKLDETGRPVVQRLILATESVAEARATAWVDVAVPETTTTTVPESTTTTTVPETTTTTTVPATTTTTVPATTTTTVPETTTTTVPTEVLGITVDRGELPRTGAGTTTPLAVVGLTAVLAGVALIAGTRRWPTTR